MFPGCMLPRLYISEGIQPLEWGGQKWNLFDFVAPQVTRERSMEEIRNFDLADSKTVKYIITNYILTNNPIPFPHFAYAEMFKKFAKGAENHE